MGSLGTFDTFGPFRALLDRCGGKMYFSHFTLWSYIRDSCLNVNYWFNFHIILSMWGCGRAGTQLPRIAAFANAVAGWCYMNLSYVTCIFQLINGFHQVVTWTCQNWYLFFLHYNMDLSKLYIFPVLCQTKASWSLTDLLRCWMSQSTQCLEPVVPLAMFW